MHEIAVSEKVLAKNDEIARGNRQRLREKGIFTMIEQ